MKNSLIKKTLAVTLALALTASIGIFSFAQEAQTAPQEEASYLATILNNYVADTSKEINQYAVQPGKIYLMYSYGNFGYDRTLIKVSKVFEDPVHILGFEVRTNRTVVGTNLLTGMTVKQSISGAGTATAIATLYEIKPVKDPTSSMTLSDQLNLY